MRSPKISEFLSEFKKKYLHIDVLMTVEYTRTKPEHAWPRRPAEAIWLRGIVIEVFIIVTKPSNTRTLDLSDSRYSERSWHFSLPSREDDLPRRNRGRDGQDTVSRYVTPAAGPKVGHIERDFWWLWIVSALLRCGAVGSGFIAARSLGRLGGGSLTTGRWVTDGWIVGH